MVVLGGGGQDSVFVDSRVIVARDMPSDPGQPGSRCPIVQEALHDGVVFH